MHVPQLHRIGKDGEGIAIGTKCQILYRCVGEAQLNFAATYIPKKNPSLRGAENEVTVGIVGQGRDGIAAFAEDVRIAFRIPPDDGSIGVAAGEAAARGEGEGGDGGEFFRFIIVFAFVTPSFEGGTVAEIPAMDLSVRSGSGEDGSDPVEAVTARVSPSGGENWWIFVSFSRSQISTVLFRITAT